MTETPQKRYQNKTIKQFKFELNRNTDPELITWLENQPNKQGLIKKLLYREMSLTKKQKNVKIKNDLA